MIDKDKIISAWSSIIEGLGLDLKDPNFQETPERIYRSYLEIFDNLNRASDDELELHLNKTFPSSYDQMIVASNITAWSFCPHHFLPVKYSISLGYMPHETVLGLSKLARLAITLAKRPLLQEQLTSDIVQCMQEKLQPKGCIVEVVGAHLCMAMRGIKSTDSVVVTNALTGCFKEHSSLKHEFFQSIKSARTVDIL